MEENWKGNCVGPWLQETRPMKKHCKEAREFEEQATKNKNYVWVDLSLSASTMGVKDTTRNHATCNHSLLGHLLGLPLLQHNPLLGHLVFLPPLLGLLPLLRHLLGLLPMQHNILSGHQKHHLLNPRVVPSCLLGEATSDMWLHYMFMTYFV